MWRLQLRLCLAMVMTAGLAAATSGCGDDSETSSSANGGAGGAGAGATGGSASSSSGSTTAAGGAGGGATAHALTSRHCPTPVAGYAAGTWLYIGGGGTQGRTAVTADGATWVDETTTSLGTMDPGHSRNLIRGAGYGGGMFVVVGGHDNAYISTSCDGVNWRQDVLGTNIDGAVPQAFSFFLSAVTYSNGVFVAAGGAGTRLVSTDHGLSWSATGEYVNGHFRGVAAGNGVFVATGHDWGAGNGLVSVSSNGESWDAVMSSPGELGAVRFGNGVFVAVGQTRCAVSPDGVSWSDCNTGINAGQLGVHFINGEFFVQYEGGSYARSADGQTWTTTSGWLPDVIAEGNGLFVMSRWSARGYSSDMVNWTEMAVPPEWGLSGLVSGEVLFGAR